MRHDLKAIDGVRTRFRATFQRFGKKSGYKVRWLLTILLVDVKLASDGDAVTDHAWMTAGKQFKDLELHSGDIIELDARVGMYQKGYSEDDEENPFRYDYRLERPTRMVKVGKADGDFSDLEKESQEIKEHVESDDLGLPPGKIFVTVAGDRLDDPAPIPPPPKRRKSLLDYIN